jgi:hypothetical protein
MARVTPGSNADERYWEGEVFAGRGMTGGARMAAREGRGWLGRAGSGWSGPTGFPGCGPGGLLASFFYFFPSVFFSFVSDFCF